MKILPYLFGISHLVLIHISFASLIFDQSIFKDHAKFGVPYEFLIALVFLAYLVVLLKEKQMPTVLVSMVSAKGSMICP
jgi:hypothetical protein